MWIWNWNALTLQCQSLYLSLKSNDDDDSNFLTTTTKTNVWPFYYCYHFFQSREILNFNTVQYISISSSFSLCGLYFFASWKRPSWRRQDSKWTCEETCRSSPGWNDHNWQKLSKEQPFQVSGICSKSIQYMKKHLFKKNLQNFGKNS